MRCFRSIYQSFTLSIILTVVKTVVEAARGSVSRGNDNRINVKVKKNHLILEKKMRNGTEATEKVDTSNFPCVKLFCFFLKKCCI